jgi:hypothetical protein
MADRLDAAERVSAALALIETVWLAAPEACPEKTSRDAVQETCSAAKGKLMEAYKLLTGADHD